jgi:uncharacterized membrane protein YecN with MAPEG domain
MALKLVALVTVLAAVEVMIFGFLVGRGRVTYGVPAPAMTGHPTWERLNRVHQNSIEQLVVFLPLLWTYQGSISQLWAFILGMVFVVARIVYAVGYVRDPERRAPGAILTFGVLTILALGSLIGYLVQIARA